MRYLIQRLDKTIKSFTRYSLIKVALLTITNCIVIFLVVTKCTDKKQITEPIVAEPKYEIRKNVAMPTTIEWSSYDESKPHTKLSYSNNLDIMLVESSFNSVLSDLLGGIGPLGFYNAVYWDSNNNTYYAVTNKFLFDRPIPVTNTNFVYALNNPNQIEPVFYPDYQEIFPDTKAPLLYIGDLSSPFERVYLDPTNQVYYIKHIVTLDTSIYEEMTYTNDGEYNHPYKEITNQTSPVYPAEISNITEYTDGTTSVSTYRTYTNKNKQEFSLFFLNMDGEETFYTPILYHSSDDLIIINEKL